MWDKHDNSCSLWSLQGIPVTRVRGVPIPNLQKVESSINNAKESEPYLGDAIQRGASLDVSKVIDDLK
jgi:hypothetical protein